MGGNALKNIETRRYLKDEFNLIEIEVVNKLKNIFPLSRVKPIAAYADKESFGDLDVLVEKVTGNWLELIEKEFKYNEVYVNGDVISFDYKEFQIDVIFTPSDEFDFSAKYFAYNDLGNLIGRVAHKFKFKFGHNGLWWIYRPTNNHVFREILVSNDFLKVIRFLGYDSDRYVNGFDSLEDVFIYAASSPFFNKDIFALENRNHTARVRDAKRKTYTEFLKWIEDKTELPNYQYTEDRSQLLQRAFDFFPKFEQKVDEAKEDYEHYLIIKEKFNGQLVSELTGLEGKELGIFIKQLKNSIPNFDSYILFATNSDIVKLITDFTLQNT